jgi:transposase
MVKRQNRQSREFKEQAIALAKGSDKSVRSVALSLGIPPQTLQYWIDHPPGDRSAAAAAPIDSNDPVALRLQLNAAREQIRVLEMEKDILKKATAYFAKESR